MEALTRHDERRAEQLLAAQERRVEARKAAVAEWGARHGLLGYDGVEQAIEDGRQTLRSNWPLRKSRR